jgi:hypothetical protein
MQQSTKRGSRINDGGGDGKIKDDGNSDGNRNGNSDKDKMPGMCLLVTEIEIASRGANRIGSNTY